MLYTGQLPTTLYTGPCICNVLHCTGDSKQKQNFITRVKQDTTRVRSQPRSIIAVRGPGPSNRGKS